MSNGNDDTQKYINDIKQGWSALSSGVVDQVTKYTGLNGGDGGVNILPANMMSMSSSEDKREKDASKAEETTSRKEDLADDPLGLKAAGLNADKAKGKRITEANKEYAGKVAEAQKYATGGAEATADDPLGLGK